MQELKKLLVLVSGLNFWRELLESELKSLLMLLSLHLFDTDVFKDRINNWLMLLWSLNLLGICHSHHSLGHDVVAVDSNVLKEGMGNVSVSRKALKELNLLSLGGCFPVEVGLIVGDFHVQLVDFLLEGPNQKVLSFLAHGFDLAGDPLIHLLLSLGGVLALELLRDLANL